MLATANGVTVIVVPADVVEHPVLFVTVTVYVVVALGLTNKLCVVPTTPVPSLHE